MPGVYGRFHRFQQHHPWLGFPLAIRQKYAEDQGRYLAVTVAYGLIFVFPLLALTTLRQPLLSRSCERWDS